MKKLFAAVAMMAFMAGAGQAADLGAEQPMADKRTDAGRASNRGGELVRC